MSNKLKSIIVKRTTIFPTTNYMEIEYLIHPQISETKAFAWCKEEYIQHAFVFNEKSSLLKKFHKAGVKEISSIFNGKGIEETEHIFVNKEPNDEKPLYKTMTKEQKEDFLKRVTIKFDFPKTTDNISNEKRNFIN